MMAETALTPILTAVIYTSLAIHLVLISYAVWRVWRGENEIDRLLATELVGTLVLSVLVLIALVEQSVLYIDVAVGLGVLGFIGIVSFAKFITERRMF